ncbi:MAG: hypothetical protein R2873_02440 [Caldilineaceae bacterium]|nr:hypothetical protein [Caldilineaceae bacterium]
METAQIRSLPAFAATLRRIDRAKLPASLVTELLDQPVVPAYQIEEGDFEKEVASATHTIAMVADKLRRLATAYGEWRHFDAPAFFDLYPAQVALLLSVSERVSTVHVGFYADLLLPSFQRMEQYWAQEFVPAYQAGYPFTERTDQQSSFTRHFFEIEQPKLIAYWERTTAVVQATRAELSDDIGFLATAGGSEERAQWQPLWPQRPALGLPEDMLPPLENIPTLTLSTSFPLPAHRQPGRLRRLRRQWARKNWRQRR